MKKIFALTLIGFMLIFGCSKDESEEVELYNKINITTGINLADDNGQALGRWGAPNDKSLEVTAYPNPAIDVLFLYSETKITDFWIIEAQCYNDITYTGSTYDMSEVSFGIEDLELNNVMNATLDAPSNTIAVNLTMLMEGHYRLFYQLESKQIGWRNIARFNQNYGDEIFVKLEEFCG